MSSPIENLAFRIVQHRTISGTTFNSTPIYSLNDPWLGIDVQLLPIPEGLFRILIIAVPTFLLPHVLNQLRLMPGQEGADNLLAQLTLFRRLYLQQRRICDTVRTNKRRLISTRTLQLQTLLKMTQGQHSTTFTLDHMEDMRNHWYKNTRVIAFPKAWRRLLSGRKHAAVEDGQSAQKSNRKLSVDGTLRSVSSTSTADLFRHINPALPERYTYDDEDHLDTSSEVTVSQPHPSLLTETTVLMDENWPTPLQSPTTPHPPSQPPIDIAPSQGTYIQDIDPTLETMLDAEAERTLDLMYPLAI